jgi:protein O-mannosyl-transferase
MTSRGGWWVAASLIAVLALAVSANSVGNGFVYDDVYAILRDPRVQSLDGWWTDFSTTYWAPRWGGDGYRPLTRLAFRVAWAIGEGSPAPFHAMNLVVHVAGSVAMLWLACGVLPFAAAVVAAALYAVHPVHTEAIANAVGLAELAVAALVITACALYIHGRRAGPIGRARWIGIGGLYAVACGFKEHAIVLPGLILLAELTVVADGAPIRVRLRALRLPLLSLAVVGLAYLWARTSVVTGVSGFVPAIPFQTLKLTTANRILTMIGAAPEWFRLLHWPARLMSDYTPPYIDIAEGPSLVQLPGALLLIGTLGLAVVCWRRNPVTTFGILWAAITLLPASNFIIPAGILVAERTLMLPSVGAMIVVGSAIPVLYERVEQRRGLQLAGLGLVLVLLALGIARSVTRNRVWASNDTLFRQGVQDAPNNYRLHYLLGNHLLETGRPNEAFAHHQEALRLFPYDPMLPYVVAEGYRRVGRCEPAITLYRWAFELARSLRPNQLGLASCLLHTMQLDEARVVALDAIRHGARYRLARDLIRAADAAKDSLAVRGQRADSVSLANSAAGRRAR